MKTLKVTGIVISLVVLAIIITIAVNLVRNSRLSYAPDQENAVSSLPYIDNFLKNRGWSGVMGNVSVANDMLNLDAQGNTTEALAVLHGSEKWQNYIYTVSVDWKQGGGVRLISHYKDQGNYLSCLFTTTDIYVDEVTASSTKSLLDVPNKVNLIFPLVSLGMKVDGAGADCYEGSQVVASVSNVDPSLVNDGGGIGIAVLADTSGNASISVSSISAATTDDATALLEEAPSYAPITANVADSVLTPVSIPITISATSSGIISRNQTVTIPPLSLPFHFNAADVLYGTSSLISTSTGLVYGGWKNGYGNLNISGPQQVTLFSRTVPVVPAIYLSANTNASTSDRGAEIMLPGSSAWTDYTFSAAIDWIQSSSVTLIARSVDSNDYVMCNYTDRGIWAALMQETNGKENLINESNNLDSSGHNEILPYGSIGISVQGNNVACLRDGSVAVSNTVPGIPAAGGIGFKIFGSNLYNAQVGIESVDVIPSGTTATTSVTGATTTQ